MLKSTNNKPTLVNLDNPLTIAGMRQIERGTCKPSSAKDPANISIITEVSNATATRTLKCPEQIRTWFQKKCNSCLNGSSCPTEFIINNFPPASGNPGTRPQRSIKQPNNRSFSVGKAYNLGIL